MLNHLVILALSAVLVVNGQDVKACGKPAVACTSDGLPANSDPSCSFVGGAPNVEACTYSCKPGFILQQNPDNSEKCIPVTAGQGLGSLKSCGLPAADCSTSSNGLNDIPGGIGACVAYGSGQQACAFTCGPGFHFDFGNDYCIPNDPSPDKGKGLVTSCGIPAKDCTATPLGLPGASAACKSDAQGNQSCSFTCNPGFVFDAGNDDCVKGAFGNNDSIAACGQDLSVCTTPFKDSFATCNPSKDNGGHTCGASCNAGFKWNPSTNNCDPLAGGMVDACGKTKPQKCTTPFEHSHATCLDGGDDGYHCGASCDDSYTWDPQALRCYLSSCPSGQIVQCVNQNLRRGLRLKAGH